MIDRTPVTTLNWQSHAKDGLTSVPLALWFLVACGFLFAAANLAFYPIVLWLGRTPAGLALSLACYGLIGAQGALHAIWCVLAPVHRTIRLAVGVVSGATLFGALILGIVLVSGRDTLQKHSWAAAAVGGALCLPLMAVAMQSPLWVARSLFRWRLVPSSGFVPTECVRPLHVRDLFVATGAVALALSGVRLAAPSSVSPSAFVVSVGMGAVALAVTSLLTTIPVTIATLRARRLWLALATLLSFDLLITIGGIAAFVSLAPEGPHLRVQEYFALATMAGAFFASLTGIMLLVRSLGARLLWGNRGLYGVVNGTVNPFS